MLVDAWGTLWRSFPDWILTIAGPDEDDFGSAMKDRSAALCIPESRIEFLGPQYGDAKWQLYNDSDLFVLPSHSENFGNVIAEALSQGIPVLTTNGTPWAILKAKSCGWWIETGIEPLKSCLAEILKIPIEKLANMGDRGRDLVEKHYNWEQAASNLNLCYHWALYPNSKRPSIILVD